MGAPRLVQRDQALAACGSSPRRAMPLSKASGFSRIQRISNMEDRHPESVSEST
jgi:hypothetical protein